jgi:hypothetical protein
MRKAIAVAAAAIALVACGSTDASFTYPVPQLPAGPTPWLSPTPSPSPVIVDVGCTIRLINHDVAVTVTGPYERSICDYWLSVDRRLYEGYYAPGAATICNYSVISPVGGAVGFIVVDTGNASYGSIACRLLGEWTRDTREVRGKIPPDPFPE